MNLCAGGDENLINSTPTKPTNPYSKPKAENGSHDNSG